MTEHTPGPWEIDHRADTHVVGRNGRHVCSTGGYASNMPADRDTYITENEANARLIAAAPELLGALSAALPFIGYEAYVPELIVAAERAIEKATGNV